MPVKLAMAGLGLLGLKGGLPGAEPLLNYAVKREIVMKHDDGPDKTRPGWFLWYQSRPAAIPGPDPLAPTIVVTTQKLLNYSDFYAGIQVMTRRGSDGPWSGPVLPPSLDWQRLPDGKTLSYADMTPGWHAPTRRLLAIGCQVRYDTVGRQVEDIKHSDQTVYAVHDPVGGTWTPFQRLVLPDEPEFNFARSACSQWEVKPDGKLLVPLYIGRGRGKPFSTTVAECSFDGRTLSYVRHGNVLRLAVKRGLYEPSVIRFGERYYLTMRNDDGAYVSASDDGLNYGPPRPWLFDDGRELGSYNTQQHWIAHSEGLFLVYTRRGANNDHMVRHRAPLFMAQVDPVTLAVVRKTERILLPERGGEMGNFGAAAISPAESWVTVSEGMQVVDARERGAEGATILARIIWSRPNKTGR